MASGEAKQLEAEETASARRCEALHDGTSFQRGDLRRRPGPPRLRSAPAPPLPLSTLLFSAHTPLFPLSQFCSPPPPHTFPSDLNSLFPHVPTGLPLVPVPQGSVSLPCSPRSAPPAPRAVFLSVLGKVWHSTPFTYFPLSFYPLNGHYFSLAKFITYSVL